MEHRNDIDGLRALAVVPIVLFHLGIYALPGGFVGVDVFFVISGYLITSIICREIDGGRFSIAAFYRRRVVRILPALLFMLAATLIAGKFWLLAVELRDLGKSAAAAIAFVANIHFWFPPITLTHHRTQNYYCIPGHWASKSSSTFSIHSCCC
ncbi:acyltransferase family protein [Sphingomonas lacusdianchii]|uniref:acyltransferase family protein n=1 Tax=Sphingomonas lacusdianchii TaxID=2917992 RepID=UPI003221679C